MRVNAAGSAGNGNNNTSSNSSDLQRPLLSTMDEQETAAAAAVNDSSNRSSKNTNNDNADGSSSGTSGRVHEQQLQSTTTTTATTTGSTPPDNPEFIEESQEHVVRDEVLPLSSSSCWHSNYNPHQLSAMISNFSTSYNVVNISLVLPMLLELENAANKTPDEDAVAAVASSLLAGMMLGQVLGGILGDVLGVERALTCVVALQILSSLGSGLLVAPNENDVDQLYWQLSLWRLVLGVGAGGVYPLAAVLSAATASSEEEEQYPDPPNTTLQSHSNNHNGNNNNHDHPHNNKNNNIHNVVLTFSTQGMGFVAVPVIAVPLLYLHKLPLQILWRILLVVGCIPGILFMAIQYKMMMQKRGNNTSDSTWMEILPNYNSDDDDADHDDNRDDDGQQQEASDDENESVLDSLPDPCQSPTFFSISRRRRPQDDPNDDDVEEDELYHLSSSLEPHSWWEAVRREDNLVRKLLGTAGTWFLFDILFYGNTLFQPIVMEAAFGGGTNRNSNSNNRDTADDGPRHLLQRTALDSLIVTSMALPGYFVASYYLGKEKKDTAVCCLEQTPRNVMLQGFAAMALLYLIIGCSWSRLRHFPLLLMVFYGSTFFFANYGPNTTTFILPSLVFSPECRSTFNGLSAAAGKLGALTGASLFEPAADTFGDAIVMTLCAVIAIVAFLITQYFVPSGLGASDDQTILNVEQQQEEGEDEEVVVSSFEPSTSLDAENGVVVNASKSSADTGIPDRNA